MNQLMIHRLPKEVTGGAIVLRHWLTMADGRIFFQEETITKVTTTVVSRSEGFTSQLEGVVSERSEWQELPLPPVIPQPLSMAPSYKDEDGVQRFSILYSDGSVKGDTDD